MSFTSTGRMLSWQPSPHLTTGRGDELFKNKKSVNKFCFCSFNDLMDSILNYRYCNELINWLIKIDFNFNTKIHFRLLRVSIPKCKRLVWHAVSALSGLQLFHLVSHFFCYLYFTTAFIFFSSLKKKKKTLSKLKITTKPKSPADSLHIA